MANVTAENGVFIDLGYLTEGKRMSEPQNRENYILVFKTTKGGELVLNREDFCQIIKMWVVQ